MAAAREGTRAAEERPLDSRRRTELRRRAARLAEGPPAAQAASRGITLLLDELDRLRNGAVASRLDPGRRLELRALAERLSQGPEGARSAAATLELLLAEVERLEERAARAAVPTEDSEDEPVRERRRMERERRRGTNGDPSRRAPRVAVPKLRRPAPPAVTLPRPRPWVLAALGAALLLVLALLVVGRVTAPDLRAEGPTAPVVGAEAAKTLSFAVSGAPAVIENARWTVDGRDVTDRARTEGGRSALVGYALQDGEHTIEVSVPGAFPGLGVERTWHIEVDRTPPTLHVDKQTLRATPGRPAKVVGSAEDAVRVTALGQEAPVDEGRFELALPMAPTTRFALVALDAAGNRAELPVRFTLVPREPRSPIRSVHLTFYSWANPALRADIMRMIDEGRINSVELDLKDESGIVGFEADLPFAKKIGAMQAIYDLPKAIETLHKKGVWVIGRIVAFRDPIHAPAAWKRGWRDQVIQTPDGKPYAGYGGFTNFANRAVRQYNIDIARRAAEAGIDDILYDYVRRPDGPISSMRFPSLRQSPEKSIASFLADARRHLAPYDTFLGASVFGVAASRPTEIAQHIPSMARHVDYVAPMVYPSHWGPGEYGVANPNAQPYDIVRASLLDFQKAVKGTGARVVPWLQDFSYGVTYGPAEVRAQIEAAADIGIDEWILWDAETTYTAEALDRHDPEPPIETVRHDPKPPLEPLTSGSAAPQATARESPAQDAARKVRANELGSVPVLMYHQIRPDGGPYDLTAAQFRAKLARLHREGYHPIRAVDLATGRIDVPAGKTPVVLTFDDSTKEQLAWDAQRRPKPNTAIAILQEFARENPEFEPTGTFYVNRDPFAGVPEGPEMLRWLHDEGWEIGNHTLDHLPFSGMGPREVQRQLVLGAELIKDAVPDAEVRTLALPLGVMPEPASLARRGRWDGRSYRHDGVFLVGAEPAPSPFARAFDRGAIPRIRTAPPGAADPEYGSTFWLDRLRDTPGLRFVSDGDPDTISFPRDRRGDLERALRGRANPY